MPMTAVDLWSEEAFEFLDNPDDFVRLDCNPLIWTVRGLRYFAPRFLCVGIQIQDVSTREQFGLALREWQVLERRELLARLEVESSGSRRDRLALRCLRAIASGNAEADPLMRRLELRTVTS